MNIAEPKNRKELRSFIGVVNYYRDMWFRRSHVLAPLASLTSKSTKWRWGDKEAKAFAMAKRIITKEAILAYPDFSKRFVIHTDASHYQLGGVISQDGRPIAFYSLKFNDAQTLYTTTETCGFEDPMSLRHWQRSRPKPRSGNGLTNTRRHLILQKR